MINVVYCPDHTPKIVVSAGNCDLPTTHYHADESAHVCSIVRDVDEPNISGAWPANAKDGTAMNDTDEWFSHLAQYIP